MRNGGHVIGITVFGSPLYQGTQGSVALGYDAAARLSLPIFFGNLFFLQDIMVPPLGTNGALWTLACEFWYYIYFPLAYLAVKSRRWWLIAAAAAPLIFVPSPHLFICWLMGGAVYWAAEKVWAGNRVHWIFPATALVAFAGLNALSKLLALRPEFNDLLLAASFSVFLAVGMRSAFGGARRLSALASFGSRSSYSLYAIHLPIVVFVCNFFAPDRRLAASVWSWTLVLLIPLIAVAAAKPFSKATEDQTSRLRNALSRRLFNQSQVTKI